MARLFAISDIHGHYNELMALMHQLINEHGFNPKEDTLVGLGDYCDGGLDTRRVINTLMHWEQQFPHWVFLKGNHSDMMLDAVVRYPNSASKWYHWWNQGGKATAYSYLPEDATDYERSIMQPKDYIPSQHLDWLWNLSLIHEHPNYYFVHAGLRQGIPIKDQSEEDMLWIREDFFKARHDFGKPVIFGHTPTPEPMVVNDPNTSRLVAVGIDTMVGDYGRLTALELDPDNNQAEPIFYSVPADEGAFHEFKGFR